MDNEDVSEFLAGALTALVGAVVGGFAAGCVAWYQARISTRQQLGMLHRQQVQHAAMELAPLFEELGRKFVKLVRCDSVGGRTDPECTNSKCYKEIVPIRQQLDHVYWVWVSWIPYPVRADFDALQDCMGYNRVGYDRLMLELLGMRPEGCPRCMHFDAIGGHLWELAYSVMRLAAIRPSPREWKVEQGKSADTASRSP